MLHSLIMSKQRDFCDESYSYQLIKHQIYFKSRLYKSRARFDCKHQFSVNIYQLIINLNKISIKKYQSVKIYQNKPQTIKHEDFTSEVLENIQVKMYHLYQSKLSSVCFPHKIIASKSIDVPFHVLIKKDEEYCNDFFFSNFKLENVL